NHGPFLKVVAARLRGVVDADPLTFFGNASCRSCREMDAESRSAARTRLNIDRSADPIGDLLDDRQAKPAAVCAGVGAAPKPTQDPGPFFRRDAGPAVVDRQYA